MSQNIISNWGRDHWSTLAYVETLATENDGVIIPVEQRMRTNRRHASAWNEHIADKYPTILKNGVIEHHDDWDCIEDMIKEGLLISLKSSVRSYKLTDKGIEIVNQLRRHKINGGTFHDFRITQ